MEVAVLLKACLDERLHLMPLVLRDLGHPLLEEGLLECNELDGRRHEVQE